MGALATVTMSHSPLMHLLDPGPGVRERVERAIAAARAAVQNFGPDLVVLFAPDHYNGFFLDVMPPFCIGTAATSVGDYDTPSGTVTVDSNAAQAVIDACHQQQLDVAYSRNMTVDHGTAQPLQLLFDGIDRVPVVPVFLNCVAPPLVAPARVRRFGEVIGRWSLAQDRRVLFLGSGGLSHDPPVPDFTTAADEDVRRQLLGGWRHQTDLDRAGRRDRVVMAGRDLAAGESRRQPLNPQWDNLVLDVLAGGSLDRVDSWTTGWFTAEGGNSAHETRTSIAAYAALAVAGQYEMTFRFYEAVPHWIAGFAITSAVPRRPQPRP